YGQAIYVGDIYNEEYIEVMVRLLVQRDGDSSTRKFLEKYNPDRKIRSLVVNWMLGTQGNIRLTDEEFYLSVNLLDQILARILVPINMYQLLATCTMWISRKLIGSDNLTASSLIDLCGNSYSIRQLLRLEQKVLRLLNFEIHSIEPYIFVNYHLRKLEIDQFQFSKALKSN
ncbi:G2/mitotic-specific cyclin-B3, partial [Gonioctena quinquepunctata]